MTSVICKISDILYGTYLINTCIVFGRTKASILGLVLLPGPPSPSLRPTTLGIPTPLGPSLALLVHSNPSFLSLALTASPPRSDGSKFDLSGDVKMVASLTFLVQWIAHAQPT